MSVVHLAITHHVKPIYEDEFRERLRWFAQHSMDQPGIRGIHLLSPCGNEGVREFGILRSFDSQADADRFYQSKLFLDWQQEISEFIEQPPTRRALTGLEAFFRSHTDAAPPRWKMAVVTFLGVLPTVLFWSSLLPPMLGETHWFLAASLINGAVVATLTWLAMPLLTRVFHRWLHP